MAEKRTYPVHYKLDGEQCEEFVTAFGQLSPLSMRELRDSVVKQLESDTGHKFLPEEIKRDIKVEGLDN